MDKFFIGTFFVIIAFILLLISMDYYVTSQNASVQQGYRGVPYVSYAGVAAMQNDSLPTVLSDLGMDSSIEPIQSAKFKAVKKPSFTVLYRESSADQTLGWYEGDSYTEIQDVVGTTEKPKPFADEGKEFCLYLDVFFGQNYQWSTDASKNTDGPHVKIYPMQEDGETVKNSYLIAWEDWGRDKDYNDMVLRLDGVELIDLDESE